MDIEITGEEPLTCPRCGRVPEAIDIAEEPGDEPEYLYLCQNLECPTLYVQPRGRGGPSE